jgi:DNA-binding CsgD family transcriptional regulator
LLAHVTLRLALAGDPASAVRTLAADALAADPLLGLANHGALLGLVVHALVIVGEADAAEAAAEAGLRTADQRGDVLAYGYASYHRALARFGRGALTLALADLEPARIPLAAGWTVAAGWIGWLLARVYLEFGDHGAAAEALRLADGRPQDSMDAALVRHARAQLALAEGRPAEAYDVACAAGLHLAQVYDIDHPGLLPWRTTAALAAHHAGDHAMARRLAAEAVERAASIGLAHLSGSALRVAGLVARPGPDVGLLSEAAAAFRGTPAALDHARTLIDLGAAMRRCGRNDEARKPLRQGLAIADRAVARPLAEQARAELHALGLRPRRAAVNGIDSLTPAERRVALLALHGQSNRQIAQTLFITTKTVETHLARAYRKLAIGNRHQLHEAFAVDGGHLVK